MTFYFGGCLTLLSTSADSERDPLMLQLHDRITSQLSFKKYWSHFWFLLNFKHEIKSRILSMKQEFKKKKKKKTVSTYGYFFSFTLQRAQELNSVRQREQLRKSGQIIKNHHFYLKRWMAIFFSLALFRQSFHDDRLRYNVTVVFFLFFF